MDREIYDRWINNFYCYLADNHPSLLFILRGRIFIRPDLKGNMITSLMDLDERYATKEQIEESEKGIF